MADDPACVHVSPPRPPPLSDDEEVYWDAGSAATPVGGRLNCGYPFEPTDTLGVIDHANVEPCGGGWSTLFGVRRLLRRLDYEPLSLCAAHVERKGPRSPETHLT